MNVWFCVKLWTGEKHHIIGLVAYNNKIIDAVMASMQTGPAKVIKNETSSLPYEMSF